MLAVLGGTVHLGPILLLVRPGPTSRHDRDLLEILEVLPSIHGHCDGFGGRFLAANFRRYKFADFVTVLPGLKSARLEWSPLNLRPD